MNRRTRRLLGLLPLLAGLGIAATWILASAQSRERDQAETSIRLRWESVPDAAAVAQDAQAYLARFGEDPDAVWFAVEAYARLRDMRSALEAVTSRARVRDEKGAARRLARLLIEPLRRVRGTSDVRTSLSSRILHVLLEAQDPGAVRDWADLSAHLSTPEAMTLFVPCSRTPSIGTTTIATSLAARTDNRELRVAGAILLAGPAHRDDVPFLLEGFQSSWREERRPTWQHIVRALGNTGDPRAVDALRAFVDPPNSDPRLPSLATIDTGLALSGDREARERLLSKPDGPGIPRLLSLYGMGLAVQLAQGDERAIPRLVELWDEAPDPMLQFQLAAAVLQADPAPPAAFPAARWAAALVGSDKFILRTLGHAYRFRVGLDTAFQSLGADLVEAAAQSNLDSPTSPEETGPGALIEVLRTWLRYGG